MSALDRAALNGLAESGCQAPGCDHTGHDGLFLHAACHAESPTWVEYRPKTGLLVITCGRCDREVARVAVKP